MNTEPPAIAVIMGSDSDWPVMKPAAEICHEFGVPCEVRVVSAHRTPLEMVRFASEARQRGIRVIIAGAGGAAHLPGMVASITTLPVIGVPVESHSLKGMDSLLSIAQMPGGVPVATMAINGGKNAGLFAIRILATGDPGLCEKLSIYQDELAALAGAGDLRLQSLMEANQS